MRLGKIGILWLIVFFILIVSSLLMVETMEFVYWCIAFVSTLLMFVVSIFLYVDLYYKLKS